MHVRGQRLDVEHHRPAQVARHVGGDVLFVVVHAADETVGPGLAQGGPGFLDFRVVGVFGGRVGVPGRGSAHAFELCAFCDVFAPYCDEIEVVARVLHVPHSGSERRDGCDPVLVQSVVLDVLEERVVLLRCYRPAVNRWSPWVGGPSAHGCIEEGGGVL